MSRDAQCCTSKLISNCWLNGATCGTLPPMSKRASYTRTSNHTSGY